MIKKLLTGLLSLVMTATITTSPFGESLNDIFEKSILLASAYDESQSNVDSSETHEHIYEATITKNPTCVEDGIKTYICECGYSYTEKIPATGHKYTNTVVKPTYFEQGYTLHQCSTCGNSYKDNHTNKLEFASVSGFKVSSTTASSAKLTWNKVSGTEGYIIYKYDNAKKTWTRVVKTKNTSNTYTVSKLNAGTTYKFAVKAYKTVDGKEVTSRSYPTTTATTKPATVTGFTSSSTSASTIKLTWDKVSNANGYIVYKYDNAKKTWTRVVKTKNASNTYIVSKLNAGTTYKFAVKAYKTVSGKELTSVSYPQVSTSTRPANVSFKLKAYPSKVTVSWKKVKGASGYIVYYKTSKNGKWIRLKAVGNNTTSYTKDKLTKGKIYYFTVKAYRNYNGKTYNGAYATKSIKPNYCFSSKPTTAEKKAAQVLDATARQNRVNVPTLYMAYRKSEVNYIHFKENPNLGTEWYANYGLTNHKGNCYVMAAMITTYARLLGYDAQQISGDIGGSVHSWCEVKISGKVYVCDMSMGGVYGRDLYYKFPYHPISKGSKDYIVGDGKHPKYHRLKVMK